MKRVGAAAAIALVVSVIAYWNVREDTHQGPDTPVPDAIDQTSSESLVDDVTEDKTPNRDKLRRVTLQAHELKAMRAGASLDDMATYAFGLDICRANAQPTSANYRPASSSPATVSLDQFHAFQRDYCQGTTTLDGNGRSVTDLLEGLARAGDGEATALLKANAVAYHGEQTSGSEDLQTQLQQIMTKTDSATKFLQAGQLLLEEEISGPGDNNPRTGPLSSDQIKNARMFGVMMATCTEFKNCGARSVFSVRSCMPDQCAPGFAVDGYIRRRLSGDEMEEAVRYATDLRRKFRSGVQ